MAKFENLLLWQTYISIIGKACDAADLDSAITVLFYALSDAEELLEIDGQLVGATHDLTSMLIAAGRLRQAKEVSRRLLETREKILGINHPDVADSLRRLAALECAPQTISPELAVAG